MNNLQDYDRIFDVIQPWGGVVPPGYRIDFVGTLTDLRFEEAWGADPAKAVGDYRETSVPFIGDRIYDWSNDEFWFEAADWVTAATEALDSFVMVTLGALFGYQAVGSYRVLQLINPMPCKLVAVDPIPENIEMTRRHFLDNGIDPVDHWLVQAAISDSNEPVFFPIGAPGAGLQNCVATNEMSAREEYVRSLIEQGCAEESLRNLLLRNSTGITKDLLPGRNFLAEIKLVTALTLADILGPFDRVDYLESDIQQSEIIVFPPFIDLLKRKVKRIHLGTHGKDVHRSLHNLFAENGWEIIFSYEPDSMHEDGLRTFKTNDGILTVRNPDI